MHACHMGGGHASIGIALQRALDVGYPAGNFVSSLSRIESVQASREAVVEGKLLIGSTVYSVNPKLPYNDPPRPLKMQYALPSTASEGRCSSKIALISHRMIP